MIKTLRNQIRVFAAVVGLAGATSQAAVIINQTGTNSLWDGISIQFFSAGLGIISDTTGGSDFYYRTGNIYFSQTSFDGTATSTAGNSTAYFSNNGAVINGAVAGSDNWLYIQSSPLNFGWVQVNVNPTNPVASSIIQYAYDNTGANLSLADAKSALSVVPEPSTVFTLIGGLLALAVWRGVRRKVVSA